MMRWRSQPAVSACWTCQGRLANRKSPRLVCRDAQRIQLSPRLSRRALYATHAQEQFVLPSSSAPTAFDPSLIGSTVPQLPIRTHLKQWDLENGGPDETNVDAFGNDPTNSDDIVNNISKLRQGQSNRDGQDNEDRLEEWEENDQEHEDVNTLAIFVKPGDVIELQLLHSEPILGVVLRQHGSHCQFYLANGRQSAMRIKAVSYVLQGYMDPALVEPLIPFLPEPDQDTSRDPIQVPPEVGSPVLAILHRLRNDTDSIYRENSSVLDNAYFTLAHHDRTRTMTVAQVAKALLAKDNPDWDPPAPALLAVRKALSHNEYRIRPDRAHHRLTNIYHIRSRKDVRNMEKVLEWVREYKEYCASVSNKDNKSHKQPTRGYQNINDFIIKARRLISSSREIRTPQLGFIGPSKDQPHFSKAPSGEHFTWATEAFTETDKHIIDFVQAWILKKQFVTAHDLYSACTTILNAVGEYQSEKLEMSGTHMKEMRLDPSAGQLFLQEIGVLGPHDNRHLYEEDLMLPMGGMSHNMELLKAKSELARRNPNFVDSMSHLRRDWGSMIVWSIDDKDAQEIDDGISIERVEGGEAEYWVHTHIANPTAFFPKSHVLSGLAAHMGSSVYTPAFSLSMLPKWLSREYFSLESNRPTITFSSRIDRMGNVLESKIQPGVVRNVQKVTYRQLSEYLGEKDKHEPKPDRLRFTVGEKVLENSPNPLPIRSKEELENLQDLYAVAKAAFSARQRGGAEPLLSASHDEVRVFKDSQTKGLPWLPPSTDRARFVHGDPTIDVSAGDPGRKTNEGIDSTKIVEEIMILTGYSAASWCAERGIPVIFKGTLRPSEEEQMSEEEYRRRVVQPQLQEVGYVSPTVSTQCSYYTGRAISHYAPIAHRILGIPCYARVTSPLRRFGDMIAHWQIEAAIRYEARTGHKLDSNTISNPSESPLPFSKAQVKQSLLTLLPREYNIMLLERRTRDFWVVQAFMRAFHNKEATLPETFQVWITVNQLGGQIRGSIPGFRFNTRVVPEDPNADIRVGDQWDCKIRDINIFSSLITVEPVRLLYRQPVLGLD